MKSWFLRLSYTKILIGICVGNGLLWVWCSYLLAFFGRPIIAEQLSIVAITEIIGVTLVYCLKSLFENLAKNNDWLNKSDVVSQNKKQDCE